jgi:hypothetical protein
LSVRPVYKKYKLQNKNPIPIKSFMTWISYITHQPLVTDKKAVKTPEFLNSFSEKKYKPK